MGRDDGHVRPAHEAEFERCYGADGAWVELFRRAPGYIDTRLLKDRSVAGRYITIDRWRNEESFRAFRSQYAQAYGLKRKREARRP
ncbi:MAG: antibiotic biosynthesis monooxygenase family protein [Steroidobacteraceae bacterium]